MSAREQVEASSGRLRSALENGGRAVVTVRSRATGEHVTVAFSAKKRDPAGGWLSRATLEGRVGIGDADMLYVDDPTLPWPEGKVGSVDLSTGEWRDAQGADPARVWAAQKAFAWAAGSFDLEAQAEVFMSLECNFCGHRLTDPVSIERGIGPECFGRLTGSKSAARKEVIA